MERTNEMVEKTLVPGLDELKKKLKLTFEKLNVDEETIKKLKKIGKRDAHDEFDEAIAMLDSAVSQFNKNFKRI